MSSRIARWVVPVVVFVVGGVVVGCGDADESTSSADVAGTTGQETASVTIAPAVTVPPGVEELIEEYLAAWVDQDEQVVRALVTDGFVINEFIYSVGTEVKLSEHIADDIEGVVNIGFPYSYQNELLGEPVVVGESPLWLVSYEENWTRGTEHLDGVATYVVVDDNGTLKIANHYWAGHLWYELFGK